MDRTPPQHIVEAFVANHEIAYGGRPCGWMAEREIERLLNEWPALSSITEDEMVSIAQDLEARYP